MAGDETAKGNSKFIKWFIILGIIILVLTGIYLIMGFFYPEAVPGTIFSNSNFKRDVNILILGLDDKESVKKGEIEANSIYVARLNGKENEITVAAVSPDEKIEDKYLKNFSLEDIQKTIEENNNIEIDYYFAMSYDGFKKIVDELSGIEVKLERQLEVPEMGLLLKEGKNLLSGKEALNFVRYHNHKNNGKERIERQQKVINGIFDKWMQAITLLNISKLYKTIIESYKSVNTNLDTFFVKEIIKFLRDHNNMEIKYEIIDFWSSVESRSINKYNIAIS